LKPTPESAIGTCESSHGSFGDGAMSITPEFAHNRRGFPFFDGWPKPTTLVHQQMYVDWLKRAWQGGLRLIQVDVGNSQFTALSFDETNKWRGAPRNPLPADDASAIGRTLSAAWEFVNEKEGKEFAEIALTPADARDIIQRGHLAIV